jgi:hypothetical protein
MRGGTETQWGYMRYFCAMYSFFEACHCHFDFLGVDEHFMAVYRVLPADEAAACGGVEMGKVKWC